MRLLYEADTARGEPVALFEKRRDELGLDRETLGYTETLIRAVAARRDELDGVIGQLAPAWPVSQMARLDTAILRIAIVEIDADDVPPPVAINEAVEMAKRYCAPGSRRLVNGALGSYLRRKTVQTPP